MIISPFTPLFFLDGHRSCGRPSPFVQFFANGDVILIQAIRPSEEEAAPCTLNGESGSTVIEPQSHPVGAGHVDCYAVELTSDGYYTVTLGDSESEPFEVTSDSGMLGRSVLIEYSPAENGIRCDVVPLIDGERQFFSCRMPGGFKDSGYEFSVDNEQFVAQTSDIVELYARESTQETLTVGWSRGVPIWFGQMLNRILTCRYVYIDSLRYARYESSVPEKSQTMEGVDSFIFSQKLQRINHLEPVKE